MSPSIEILKFTATDAYKADPTVFNEALELIAQAPGVIRIHSGPDAQEPQYGWLVVVWEALKYHQDAIANNETYAKIKEALGKAAAKVEFMHDATFSADLSNALTAPVTEIVAVDVHPTTDLQEFNKRRTALVDKIVELSPSIWHGGGWGATHDNDRKLWICFGWDSPEAFKTLLAGTPEVLAIIGQLRALADANLCLARLTKYEKK